MRRIKVSDSCQRISVLKSFFIINEHCYFLFQTTHEFKQLVNLLIFTIKTQSPELAFHAAVSLGRLCVVEPVSKKYLITRLPGLSPRDKGEVSSFSVNEVIKFLKRHLICT